ncbi:MAG: hypothetical protein H0V73_07330 [Chloroflexi bacterium]|nr:hypothetical protein [Chloroflexota bacterium]
MNERPTVPAEHLAVPPAPAHHSADAPAAIGLDDPRALQILSTEHWSVLATRSLIWNESFARAGLFISLLSASVVALSLMSANGGNAVDYALILLPVTLFVGIATFFRLDDANREEALWMAAMNRIRHAYVTIVPAVADRLTSGYTDDPVGIGRSYGLTGDVRYTILHFFVTMPGMIAVVDAVIAAAIAAAALTRLRVEGSWMGAAAVVVGLVMALLLGLRSQRAFNGTVSRFQPKYPEPPLGASAQSDDGLKVI